MSWFDHLALTGTSLAALFKGRKCLVLTRAGMSLDDLAALEKELDCRFTVLRPVAGARKLGGPFRRLKGSCWSAGVPGFFLVRRTGPGFPFPPPSTGERAGPGPRGLAH